MVLWRGFREHAVLVAQSVRRRMGVGPHERIDTTALAEEYKIVIASLSEIGCAPDVVRHFTSQPRSSLSGLILPVDGEHLLIYNDSDSLERIRSTVGHEVSHLVLQHEHRVRLSYHGQGCTNPDRDQEDEAAELGREILIPREVARQAAIEYRSVEDVALQFGTSIEMAQWCLNKSGGANIRKNYTRA